MGAKKTRPGWKRWDRPGRDAESKQKTTRTKRNVTRKTFEAKPPLEGGQGGPMWGGGKRKDVDGRPRNGVS